MRTSPVVVCIYLIGIFINSLGRLVLSPLHYPVGLPLTTIGYVIWATSYLYIAICKLVAKRFSWHIAFWLVFTALAPVQYMAADSHNERLNSITSAILIAQLGFGAFIETRNYRLRQQAQEQVD